MTTTDQIAMNNSAIIENLTVNQKLAAQIVARLGNLIVKCTAGEYGTRRGKIIDYDTYADENDEFGTDLSIVEVFTDDTSFILDHVNLIKGYDDNKTVEKFYFTKNANETPQPTMTTIKTADDTVVLFDGKFHSVFSKKYLAAIVQAPNGVISYCIFYNGDTQVHDVAKHEVSYDTFFDILEARGAFGSIVQFEVGKVYRLNSHVRKCNLKAIKRSSVYLTFAELNDFGQVTGAEERYKVKSNGESEFVEVNAISRVTSTLYATDLVVEVESANVEDYAVTVEAQDVATDAGIELATVNTEFSSKESAPVDDFDAKLAELQAIVDAARIDYDAKTAERMKLQATLDNAKNEEYLAYENLRVATKEFDRFGDAKARELRENLITDEILATRDLIIYSQEGYDYRPALKSLGVWFIDSKFEIRCDKEASNIIYTFATYDTPAQVTAAINLLKAAIERGDKEFKFPTVDELNNPHHTPKRDRQRDDAVGYEEIEAKAIKYDDTVKALDKQIETIEDDCAFNQVCYDEPDDSRERMHFDAELKKLIDRGLRLIKKRDKLATHRDRLYLTIEKLDAQAI